MKKFIVLILFAINSIAFYAQVNTDKLMNVGANAMYFKDYVLSIQYFNRIIQAKPYLDMPYLYRAYAKINLEDYIGAMADVDSAIRRNEFIPMAYYAKGFLHNRLKQYYKAEQSLTKALELSPENLTFIIGRLEALDHQKKYEEELRDINFAIKKLPEEPQIAMEKSRVLLLMGDTVAAIASADSLRNIYPRDAQVIGMVATLMLITEDRDSALTLYNKAIDLKSDNFIHFLNRGNLRYDNKNYRGAIADYNKAISLEPQNEQALFNRALIMIEVGDYNQSLQDLDQILSINPTMDEAIYERALVCHRLGRLNEAIEGLSSIIEKYEEFAPAYYQRAAAYEALGKKKLAYQDMQATIAINDKIKKRQKNGEQAEPKTLDTTAKTAKEESKISDWAKLFDSNPLSAKNENRFGDNKIRGAIQNRNVAVTLQADFRLSFYPKKSAEVETSDYFLSPLQSLNRTLKQDMKLYIVSTDNSLTQDMIAYHFSQIDHMSHKIDDEPNNSEYFFFRGINFSEVKDFQSALSDLNRSIEIEPTALAYFSRAEIRHKQLSIEEAEHKASLPKGGSTLLQEKSSHDFELILRDYEMAIRLCPDFSMALYNRANMLAEIKDYQSAIEAYSQAISITPNMAEAYFNRGLTYIYTADTEKGIADLSKAGELGIYSAYNLIKKLMK